MLDSPSANPPVAAAVLNVTVQLSVPAPVIDPLAQVRALSTGTVTPVPFRAIAVEAPLEELLMRVIIPETEPAVVGSNCTVTVTV